MNHHLNTLFITTQGAYVAKEGQALAVRVERQVRMRIPLHNLGGVVCFGRVGCSPAALGACAAAGVAVTFLSMHGRFVARVSGFTPGNVLLRREQYRRADDAATSAAIARNVVRAKIANCRSVLVRAAREQAQDVGAEELRRGAARLSQSIDDAGRCDDLDRLRGIEGEAARSYFAVFNHMIRGNDAGLRMTGRNRRPPLDPVNAMLSFLYAMLTHDARAACEAAGLDAAVGFLHRDRPGRPALALDLVEEFRAYLADRVALSLINRAQVRSEDFKVREGGGIEMSDDTRKIVITEYQKRKQDKTTHPFLNEEVTLGLLIHLQARLLARHLRGELDAYPAFLLR